MLKQFLTLFEDATKEQKPAYSFELATAALLSEIVNADNEVTEDERKAYQQQLKKHVNIDDEALALLLEEGNQTSEDAIDVVQFTRVVNEHCGSEEKANIIRSLWTIAYADKTLAPLEESTIRQIADLLYVPHSQFIKTKLDVKERQADD
ncbi:tellurite resistance TerB family protein [Alteromonas sp. BMJM2]|uniref:tellurite resistance TerB family protein n=1 Tax=Alteromonas sp. BMJM2 TaxID=2954241 RepID=UPI0022B442DA|nr:TerB family tellurite resistance protein [Alteromonas sp. BMJM2]